MKSRWMLDEKYADAIDAAARALLADLSNPNSTTEDTVATMFPALAIRVGRPSIEPGDDVARADADAVLRDTLARLSELLADQIAGAVSTADNDAAARAALLRLFEAVHSRT